MRNVIWKKFIRWLCNVYRLVQVASLTVIHNSKTKFVKMNKKCSQCDVGFEFSDEDLLYLERISPVYGDKKYTIPNPELCPDCRQHRRIAWRNERSLYRRKCSSSGKPIIAMYHEDHVFPVYDNDVWWGDSWDACDYGRDFNFERSFFEQMKELNNLVPHFSLAVATTTCENSDYANHAGYLKNCYLVYNTDYAERCMYSKGVNRCFDCLDCFKVYDSEACYECMNSYNCKFCTYVWDSETTSDSQFCYNLTGCKNCFLSVNLQNQEYIFENKKLSPEEWKKKVDEYRAQYSLEHLFERFLEMKARVVVKNINDQNTENCTGNYLVNCKNCEECYDCEYLENSKHCYDLKKGDGVSYGNMDLAAFGVGVVDCYEGGTVGYNANHCLFGENVWESFDVHYSMMCVNNCKNCFGCVGLKKKEYCILNKQYSKEEYEALVPRIIEHMQKTGEWGEFFPIQMSPFGYNETMAQEYYPLNKEEVVANEWKWKDKEESDYREQTCEVLANIEDVDESICDEILACEKTERNFKIQEAELKFYKKRGLPIPRLCPDVRHLNRLKYRNPRKLWERECGKCGIEVKTSYKEGRSEKVYCEKCYLKEVY